MDQRVRRNLGNSAGESHGGLPAQLRRGAQSCARGLPLYQLLADLAHEGFTGTVAELGAQLDSMVSEAIRSSGHWPKASNALGNALRRMATNLRAAGIELQFSRNDEQGRRMVSLLGAARVQKKDRQLLSVAVSKSARQRRSVSPALSRSGY